MSAADRLSRIVANLHLTDVAQSAIDGTLDPRMGRNDQFDALVAASNLGAGWSVETLLEDLGYRIARTRPMYQDAMRRLWRRAAGRQTPSQRCRRSDDAPTDGHNRVRL